MIDDLELLRRYLDEGSEAAFADLVRRHVDLVYGAAFRRTDGNAALAEDITQQVFTTLARSAPALRRHSMLPGWLYIVTRHAAANTLRAERRRKLRERQIMNDPTNLPELDWHELRPELDAVIDQLPARERDAVLLRFFGGKPFADIGTVLSISEDAARMRVERALEKLRLLLALRGIASSATALSMMLATHAAIPAPASFAPQVASAALAGAAASGGASTAIVLMSLSKTQLGLAAAFVVAGAVGLVWQQQTQADVRAALASLDRQRDEISRFTGTRSNATTTVIADQEPARAELTRLRAEAAALRAQLGREPTAKPALIVAGLVPASAWRNAGFGTPADALETIYWAKERIDLETLGNAISLDTKAHAKADALFARLPAWLRAQFPELSTPERLVGVLWALSPPVEAIAVERVAVASPDDVTLTVKQQWENGEVRGPPLTFRRTSVGWKWAIPEIGVDMAARAVDVLLQATSASKP